MKTTPLDSSPKSSRLIEATPFFYGWVILIVGTIGSIMIGPSQTFTVGIFIDQFIADLGISRANVSLIYGLATLSASLLLPLTGRLVDRHGSRRMALIVAFLLGLACVGMAGVGGAVTVFAGLLALRFLGFGSLQLVSNNLIAQWFIRQRGMVMGLSGLSLSIGLIIFPALAEWLITRFDWRMAWVVFGLLVWAVMLPVSWFFFKDKPEQYGLKPDGDGPVPAHLFSPTLVAERNWTLAEARHTGIFWLFLIALSTMSMVLAGLVFHQLSLFEVRGLSRESAIHAFRGMALFAVIGNLGMGRLLDRFSARSLLAVALLLLLGAMLTVQVMATAWQAFAVGGLMGLVSGSFRVMDATVWPKYFGRLHLGSIKGATSISIIGCTALGPYLLGFSFDYFGSYGPALNGLLLLPLASGVLAFLVKRPAKEG